MLKTPWPLAFCSAFSFSAAAIVAEHSDGMAADSLGVS
jgi:hypothetical protein